MPKLIAAEAGVKLTPSLRGFKKDLERQLKAIPAEFHVDVKANTKGFVAEVEAAKKAVKGDVHIGIDDRGSIANYRRKMAALVNDIYTIDSALKGVGRITLTVVGIAQLDQLASAAASATSSIKDLSGAVALLPAALSQAASATGALKIGMSGLKEAFRAHADASKNAAQNTKDLAKEARDAKRSLEDLHAEMRDAPLDEAEALLDLRDAQDEVANSWGKSARQRQRDMLSLERAESRLADVRVHNNRLGEDIVVANEEMAASQRAAAGSTDELAAAMANISPNMQDFLNKVTGLSAQWTQLKNTVGDRLFEGLGDEVVTLAQNLPLLERGLGGVASALNDNFKTALRSVGSDQNKSFLERIFGNNAEAQKLLSNAIDPLITSFMRLTAVGSDFLPRLANGITDVAERFDNFLAKADADGSLQEFINDGIEAWKDLGNILLDSLSIINSVAEAWEGAGGRGLLDLLADGTEKLSEFLGSADGKTQLISFFQEARDKFNQWLPTLQSIWEAFREVISAVQDFADDIRPFLEGTADLLANNEWLVRTLVTAYIGFRTIPPLIAPVAAAMGTWRDRTNDVHGASNKLKSFIGAGGPLMAAATALVTFMAGQFVSGMAEGEAALRRQKEVADDLRASLDEVTGAATNASQALIIGGLQSGKNAATGEDYGNLLPELEKRGVDIPALTNAIASGDKERVEALLAPVKGATAQDIEKTEFWKRNSGSLQGANLTAEDVAKAVNGDKEAIKRFEDWAVKRGNEVLVGIPGANLSMDQLRGLEGSVGAVLPDGGLPDLLDVKSQLPGDVQTGSNIRGTVTEQTSGIAQGQALNREANQAQYGNLTLNPGNPFGPGATAYGNGNGASVLIPRVLDPSDPLWTNAEANGGTVTPLLNGTRIDLSPERARLYIPGFADGGLVRGPGHGTSDSILAALSNKEYINRAASVQKYGVGFFDALNAGAIPPEMLPRFDKGGLNNPILPIPAPAPTTPGSNPIQSSVNAAGGVNGSGVPIPFPGLNGGPPSTLPGATGVPVPTQPRPTPPTVKDYLSGAGAQVLDTFNLPGPNVHPGLADRTNLLADAGRAVFTDVTGIRTGLPGEGGIPNIPTRDGYNGPNRALIGRRNIGESPKTGQPPASPPHGGSGAFPGPHGTGGSPGNLPHAGTGNQPGPRAGSTYVAPPATPAAVPTTPAAPPGLLPPGLPENLQPQSILQQIGSILLDAFLGFFGIDPTYINMAKEALGLIPQAIGGAAGDPAVQAILDDKAGETLVPEALAALPANAVREAYGLPAGSSGPIDGVAWVDALEKEFGVQAATYAGHQEGSGLNKGIDWTGSPEAMRRFAEYVKTVPGMEQVIFMDPRDGTKIGVDPGDRGANQSIENYYRDNWAGHQDHVHTRQSLSIPPPIQEMIEQAAGTTGATPKGGVPLVQNADGTWTSPNPAWAALIGRESGGINQRQKIIDANSGGNEAEGIFQITPATWRANGGTEFAPNALAATPHQQAIVAARIFRRNPSGSDWGAGLPGRENAEELLAGLGGFASGGLSGGNLALISNGEYRTNPASVAKYGVGFFDALNSGNVNPKMLPKFASGGWWNPEAMPPPKPNVGARAGTPIQQKPPAAAGAAQGYNLAVKQASAPQAGANREADPRSTLGEAPKSQNHNLSAVNGGISGVANAIASAASTALSAAGSVGGAMGGGPAAGAAAGLASSAIQSGAQIGAQAVSGAVNVLSSLMVGTLTSGTTEGAYGTPLLPQANQTNVSGPRVQNNYGDIQVGSYEEFHRGQERREAQQASPFLAGLPG